MDFFSIFFAGSPDSSGLKPDRTGCRLAGIWPSRPLAPAVAAPELLAGTRKVSKIRSSVPVTAIHARFLRIHRSALELPKVAP